MIIRLNNYFDIDKTITCGQIFRYEEIKNGYIVILKDRVIILIKDGNYILIESNK